MENVGLGVLFSSSLFFCIDVLFHFLQQLEKEIAADEKVQKVQDKR
jgi:hypothetical protein